MFSEKVKFKKANAVFTYRSDGISDGHYDSLNVSEYVGDDFENVQKNRDIIAKELDLEDSFWFYPKQKHSTIIREIKDNKLFTLPSFKYEVPRKGIFNRRDYSSFDFEKGGDEFGDLSYPCDGLITSESKTPCVIQTADCMPVAFLSENKIAAIHAGWQGVKKGILRKAFDYFLPELEAGNDVKVFLGPCIRRESNEFSFSDAIKVEKSLPHHIKNVIFDMDENRVKCYLDLPLIVKKLCEHYGYEFEDSGIDTVTSDNCFSYRRETITGRHALVVWLD